MFGESAFSTKVGRKPGDEDGTGGDGMYEFEGEELTSADESTIVLVDKAKGNESKEIGECQMNGEVRIGVGYEVEPVTLFGRPIARSRVVETAPVVIWFVANPNIVL